MKQSNQCAARDQPCGIRLKSNQDDKADYGHADGKWIDQGGGSYLNGNRQHQSEGCGVDSIQKAGSPLRIPYPFDEQTADANVNERWQKNSQCGDDRAWQAAQQITDKCGCGEKRPRRDLTDRNRVDQLFIGQPAQVEHEIGAQECQ